MDHYTYSTLISVAARSLPWKDVERVLHDAIKENLATNYVFSSLIKELKRRKNQLDNDYVYPSRESLLRSSPREQFSNNSDNTFIYSTGQTFKTFQHKENSTIGNTSIDDDIHNEPILRQNKLRAFSNKYLIT